MRAVACQKHAALAPLFGHQSVETISRCADNSVFAIAHPRLDHCRHVFWLRNVGVVFVR